VSAIIFDFKATGRALRKQRIGDWRQPAEPESEPNAVEPAVDNDTWYAPFAQVYWPRNY
jgi:hypothetical protein